VCGLTLIDSPH